MGLGLSLGLGLAGAAGGVSTPTNAIDDLFNPKIAQLPAGYKGSFLLPGSTITPLYQERTGASATTPAVADGVVGTVYDSITDTYIVAPSDAARPIYRVSGGVHWLESDGTKRLVSSAAIDFSDKNQMSLYAAARSTAAGTQQVISALGGVAATGSIGLQTFGVAPNVWRGWSSDKATGGGTWVVDQDDQLTQLGRIPATSISTCRENGTEVGTTASAQAGTAYLNATIGDFALNTGSNLFTGRIYGRMWVSDILGDTLRDEFEAAFSALIAGV